MIKILGFWRCLIGISRRVLLACIQVIHIRLSTLSVVLQYSLWRARFIVEYSTRTTRFRNRALMTDMVLILYTWKFLRRIYEVIVVIQVCVKLISIYITDFRSCEGHWPISKIKVLNTEGIISELTMPSQKSKTQSYIGDKTVTEY